MLKRIIQKMISREVVQRFPSDSSDSSQEGFIVISSPEDIVELISTPGFVSEEQLKKIIRTGINMLSDEVNLTAKNSDK